MTKDTGSEDSASEDLEQRLRPELDEALLALDELALDDPEEALAMFDSLPEPVQALPDFQLTLARAHQTLGQLEAAVEITLRVLSENDENADAHHLAGDLLEDLGRTEEATLHFLRTLSLDRADLDASHPESELLRRIKEEALRTLQGLPQTIRPRLSVLPLPSEAEVKEGVDPRALCRFSSDRNEGGVLHLYATNLHAEYGDLEEFDEFMPHVKSQLREETAQSLGLSEQERKTYLEG